MKYKKTEYIDVETGEIILYEEYEKKTKEYNFRIEEVLTEYKKIYDNEGKLQLYRQDTRFIKFGKKKPKQLELW